MKPYKIGLTFTILVLTFILSCGERCGPTPKYFEITSLKSSNLRFVKNAPDLPWENIAESDTVAWKNYFIRISYEPKYYSSTIEQNRGGSNLFADCFPPGYSGSTTGIDTIFVITESFYNVSFAAGDTINSMVILN